MDDKSSSENNRHVGHNAKQEQLDKYRIQNTGKPMTTQEEKKIRRSGPIKGRSAWSYITSGL